MMTRAPVVITWLAGLFLVAARAGASDDKRDDKVDDTGDNQSDDGSDDGSDGAQAIGEAVPVTHSVQRGDTLWNISEKYFKDPWRWPKVWSLNPEIANPHWIFPGQILRVRDADAKDAHARTEEAPSGGAAAAAAGSTPAAMPRIRAARPRLAESPDVRQLGFVDEGQLKAAGFVSGSVEEKILLASGDHAYVEFPKDHPPKGGARYSVYEVDTENPIREPGSRLVLGYLVHVFGDVVIDTLTDRPIANGRLLDLVEPVERGYRVGPIVRSLRTLAPRTNESNMTARIVAAVEPNLMIARQMFVVLNRGSRHGLAVGNRFVVLRQGDGIKRVMEGWDTMDHRFPPHAIAEIVTVDVQNETSVGWISRSSRELRVGDVADMRQGY